LKLMSELSISNTPLHLLYMEDDPGLARLCKTRLQRQGYQTTIAVDGQQGIALCEQNRYAALLVDYSLPFYNGLEVIQILREKNRLTEFIMITGHGDERVAVQAMKNGAFDYLIKDAEGQYLDDLPTILANLFDHQQAEQQKLTLLEKLAKNAHCYQKIVENHTDLICCFDPTGLIKFVNERFCQYFAKSSQQVIGQRLWQYVNPHYHSQLQQLLKTLALQQTIEWLDYEVITAAGEKRWINASLQIFSQTHGQIQEYQLIGRDVTRYKRVENTLQSRQKRLDLVTSSVGDGVVMLDAKGHFTFLNPQASQLLGQPHRNLYGQSASKYMHFDSINPQHFMTDLKRYLNHHQDDVLTRADGSNMPVSFIATPILERGHMTGIVIAFHDISERKQLETQLNKHRQKLESNNHRLKKLLRLDTLTSLANRRYFNEALEQEWQKALYQHTSLTVVMIDVDFFKAYNDFYGHQVGDVCLKWVAKALKNALCRSSDLVARYGGEEFVALLPGCEREGAVCLAERFCTQVQNLKIPHEKSELACRCVTISAGVASLLPTEQHSPQTLLRAADNALYAAKAAGRNQVSFTNEIPDIFDVQDVSYPN